MTRLDFSSYERRLRELDSDFGFPFTSEAATNSTNDDAMLAARDGAEDGSVFHAETQRQGRGRRGATWHSEPGTSLTFSVILRPRLDASRVSVLSLVTGLAVRSVLARLVTSSVLVKWPNDVLIEERKIAGILVESQLTSAGLSAVIVGVGLNLGPCEFPPEIRERATTLVDQGARDVDPGALLAELVHEISRRIQAFAGRDISEVTRELESFDALRGKRVEVDGVEGIAAGIGADGSLLIQTAQGPRSVISGTVTALS